MPRLYMLSLIFVVSAILFAFLLPFAAAFQSQKTAALLALFFFLAMPSLGYAYLWHTGYLERPRFSKRPDGSDREQH